MRLRNVKNAKEIVSSSRYSIDATNRIDIDALFSNENPVHVEIGMGKGDFLIGMAEKYPDINFIGVERYESVLVRAVENWKIRIYLICELLLWMLLISMEYYQKWFRLSI